jgi:large subunit ribosomal protein L18e
MRKQKSTNPELRFVVHSLRKKAQENNASIWYDVAERLSSSRRRRVAVNLSRLNRYTKTKDVVVVPGKVLGTGSLKHSISVAAFSFSDQAKVKISKAKSKCLSILDLLESNPKGSNVRILE